MLKKGDLLLVIIIVILAFSVYLFKSSLFVNNTDTKLKAQIIQNNKVIKEIDLSNSKSEQIDVSDRYKEFILVENGKIRFEDADCPDKICVNAGWLSKKGDIAVCLPNKTMIKILGQREKIDVIAY